MKQRHNICFLDILLIANVLSRVAQPKSHDIDIPCRAVQNNFQFLSH